MYTIGVVSEKSGLPTKTVRYYADINLVRPSGRSDKGYRLYSERELNKLIFVRRARAFDFSIDDCKELLGLYEDRERSSRDVKNIALQKLDAIETKMRELETLHAELKHLADACQGDHRPDCPIIQSLARTN